MDAKDFQRCFICEVEFGGLPRLHEIAGHDGVQAVCSECEECMVYAELDWNDAGAVRSFIAGVRS